MEEERKLSLKELVRDNVVKFSHYRQENFYYNLEVYMLDKEVGFMGDAKAIIQTYNTYQFPVGIDDIGNATMLATDKAITFMRWIRAAMDSGQLIKLK